MSKGSRIIFVCEHGAAKSIIAAAYFNKLAKEKNLEVHAMARGTHPDPELSPKTVEGLLADGLDSPELKPHLLELEDLENTGLIVSFCELPHEYQQTKIEQWNDVPPVSENYEQARDTILGHMNSLFVKLDLH
jgi:protein-tyrosine-phosphatase